MFILTAQSNKIDLGIVVSFNEVVLNTDCLMQDMFDIVHSSID